MADPNALGTGEPADGAADRPSDPSSPGPGSVVDARPSEYEAATMQWLYETVDMLMCARDPDYANLGSERVEWLPEAAVELPDGQEMVIEPYRIAATGSVAIDPVIAGDFDDLHAVVSSIADQRLEQTMRALFAALADVSQRTGNTVEIGEDGAEGLLALMEITDMDFDEHGNLRSSFMVSSADAEWVRAQQAGFTPDQQRRSAEIINRKREAYYASRRRRRLPRHGY